ncbi:MAG: ABC transporter permease [Candidatus Nanopelagicales bacterium]
MIGMRLEPRPGAASVPSRIAAQTATEVRLTLRNGEQLLLTILIPLLLLVGLTVVPVDAVSEADGRAERLAAVLPGVIALAVMSTAFTGLAIGTGFERRYGVLKFLGSTPLSRSGLVAAKTLAVLAIEALQVLLLLVVAALLGWSPTGAPLAVLIVVLAGTAAFAGLALLMAGTLRAEATLAAANLVYLLLLLGGGVVVPLDRYPNGVQPFIELLPSGALGEGLRIAMSGGGLSWSHVLVMVTWALAGLGLAARTFHWE